MPVFKYRSVDEMPEQSVQPWDPSIPRRMRFVCGIARFAGPLGVAPGVYKYHSLAEMSAAKERWEDARIERIRRERARKK